MKARRRRRKDRQPALKREGEWNRKGKTAPSNASAKGTMQCANKSLPELSRLSGFNSFFSSKFAPASSSPEVEVLERLQTRDGVRNGADGVVVEYEPLHRIEVGALLRQLGQLVARHI